MTLHERAIILIQTEDYLNKVSVIKSGSKKYKSMDFVMEGIKLEMPFAGLKVTHGYLKKETKQGFFGSVFQNKFCTIDLRHYQFKYAKGPTSEFRTFSLREITDVKVENDNPSLKLQGRKRDNSLSMFSSVDDSDGFNFVIKTTSRDYRMQCQSKQEQLIWLRALSVIFELRARVA